MRLRITFKAIDLGHYLHQPVGDRLVGRRELEGGSGVNIELSLSQWINGLDSLL
jgi:hypothetical protein